MEKIDLLSCKIAHGGDLRNIQYRGPSRPVTYPELFLLRYIHGEHAITDVQYMATEERDRYEEFGRLGAAYNREAVAAMYPGAAGHMTMPMQMQDAEREASDEGVKKWEEYHADIEARITNSEKAKTEQAIRDMAEKQLGIQSDQATIETAKETIAATKTAKATEGDVPEVLRK